MLHIWPLVDFACRRQSPKEWDKSGLGYCYASCGTQLYFQLSVPVALNCIFYCQFLLSITDTSRILKLKIKPTDHFRAKCLVFRFLFSSLLPVGERLPVLDKACIEKAGSFQAENHSGGFILCYCPYISFWVHFFCCSGDALLFSGASHWIDCT